MKRRGAKFTEPDAIDALRVVLTEIVFVQSQLARSIGQLAAEAGRNDLIDELTAAANQAAARMKEWNV